MIASLAELTLIQYVIPGDKLMELQLNSLSNGAKYILQDNPFFVLGLSSTSREDDATKIIKKMRSLESFGASSSYRTDFNLSGIVPPERTVSTMQVALDKIKDNKYRWLWFTSSEIKYNDKIFKLNDNWREIGSISLSNNAEYDVFLLYFLNLLIEDSTFSVKEKWTEVFNYINCIILEKKIFNLLEKTGTNFKELHTELINVFTNAINGLSIKQMCDFYVYLESLDNDSIKDYIINYVDTQMSKWAENSIIKLVEVNSSIDNKYPDIYDYTKITEDEATEVLSTISEFDEKNWDSYCNIEKKLSDQSPLKEKIRFTIIQAYNKSRIILQFACNCKFQKKAAYFYSKSFYYCRLVYPEIKDYWSQGLNIEYLDIPLRFFDMSQLKTKASYYFKNKKLEHASKVCNELIRRNYIAGYRYLFDYYIEIKDLKKMLVILDQSYEKYKSLEKKEKNSNYNDIVYILLSADLYGIKKGMQIYISDFDPTFSYNKISDKERLFNLGKKIIDLEQANQYIIGWYLLMHSYLLGNYNSCEYLGECYDSGLGVEQDSQKAFYYYYKGCKTNLRCICLTGLYFYYGNGTDANKEMGIKYMKYAADLGSYAAKEWLDENEPDHILVNGYKNYNLKRDSLIVKNHYCSIYLKDIDYCSHKNIELRLWILNRNSVSVTLSLNLATVNDNKVNDVNCIEIQPKELRLAKCSFNSSLLSGHDTDKFEVDLNIKDKDKFVDSYPVLLKWLNIKFETNNKEKKIEYSIKSNEEDKPLVNRSVGYRNRDKSLIEIALPFGSNKRVVNILKDAGYEKVPHKNRWIYIIKNPGDTAKAEQVAQLITGNRIMG